jgi:hypothetical protein
MGKGYINIEFKEEINDTNSFLEEQTFDLEFLNDDDKPKGYWLHLGEAILFFRGNNIVDILNNIKEETRKHHNEVEIQQQIRMEADRFIEKETWNAIDNTMEK